MDEALLDFSILVLPAMTWRGYYAPQGGQAAESDAALKHGAPWAPSSLQGLGSPLGHSEDEDPYFARLSWEEIDDEGKKRSTE